MKIYEGCGNVFVMDEVMQNVKEVCEREACDGFILADVEKMKMTIYNRDGSLAKLCVNGLRCFVQYCFDKGVIQSHTVYVATDSGKFQVNILYYYPFLCEVFLPLPQIEGHHVSMGNHHIVLFNHQLDKGEKYSRKYDCNVNFVKLIHENRIGVITYERGVGFTNSCGSGAVASAYYAYMNNLCDSRIEVINKGGRLLIEINNQIQLTGPSRYVRDVS